MPHAAWLAANAGLRMDALLDGPLFPPMRRAFHVERYRFAAGPARGQDVADIACGLGYGARVLMDGGARSVVGVDLDPIAADYATTHYGTPAVSFRAGDAADTGLPDGCVGVVTSFETLEHVADDEAAVEEFARLLRPGGVLICSVPSNWGTSEYHVRNYDAASLLLLLSGRFNRLACWNQNSGDGGQFNRGQPAGIERTNLGNAATAECLIAMGWKRG